MLDMERFQSVLTKYIADFPRRWNEEQEYYKWEAVQHFQKTWDIEAKDFAVMLANALAKASNLLANTNNYPAGMIIFLPVGMTINEIDNNLLIALDSFGSERGVIAHQTKAQQCLTPDDVEASVNNILALLEPFDEKIANDYHI